MSQRDPERGQGVAERVDARHYGDSRSYRQAGTLRGECMDCGAVATATVLIDESTGVAGWTCPQCDKTQEPPRPVGE